MMCLTKCGLNGAMHRPVSYGVFMVSIGYLETESYVGKKLPSTGVLISP